MPTIEWNKKTWDGRYHWNDAGEEWSGSWGGSYAQWITTIYPKISTYIPAQKVLEIAPGYGRWTRFLIDICDQYWGVDISEKCIEHCKERFADYNEANFIENDGQSLEMIEEDSIDFCFSYDSLVHVEIELLEKYIQQIIQKLNKNGVAFIHHSNYGEYIDKEMVNKHCRATSVTAGLVNELIKKNGGRVLVQEKYNWGEEPENLIDCITLFCRNDNERYIFEEKLISNPNFMQEAQFAREVIASYLPK